jgi:hypothetical protein
MDKIRLDEIKTKAYPILKKAGVTRSSLFGSYVRGEQSETSDIDIIVDFPRGKGLFEFAGLQMELEEALNRKVDLLTYNSLNHLVKEQILSEQITIYEEGL